MLHSTAVLYYSAVLSLRISPFWRYSALRVSGLGRSERSDIFAISTARRWRPGDSLQNLIDESLSIGTTCTHIISEAQRARWNQRREYMTSPQKSHHPPHTSWAPPHHTFLALKLTSFALHSVSSGPPDLIRSLRTFSFQICGSAN